MPGIKFFVGYLYSFPSEIYDVHSLCMSLSIACGTIILSSGELILREIDTNGEFIGRKLKEGVLIDGVERKKLDWFFRAKLSEMHASYLN